MEAAVEASFEAHGSAAPSRQGGVGMAEGSADSAGVATLRSSCEELSGAGTRSSGEQRTAALSCQGGG